MPKERDRFFQEFESDGTKSTRATDNVQSNAQARVAGNAGMNVKMKALMPHAAREVKFAHRFEVQLVEESRNVQPLICRVAFQVVGVEDQPAPRSRCDGIQESRRSVLCGRVGQQMNDVLKKKGNAIALLQAANALANQIECLVCAGKREHGSHVLARDNRACQVLAVPL